MTNGALLVSLDPARVKPFADQPRKRFRGIRQLCESIREIGQVTPIVVTACDEPGYDAELVDGERRLQACLLGNMRVVAVLSPTAAGNGDARFAQSVAGNFCRQGHDAVEIMEAIASMRRSGRAIKQIATIVGKTESWVEQYNLLAKLAPEVLERLKVPPDGESSKYQRSRGKMTLSLALALVPLPHNLQIKASRQILAHKMSLEEARTYIRRLGAVVGIRTGKQMGPRRQFRAVAAAVARCHHVVERYLRMPGIEIKALIRNAEDEERRAISMMLESLCETLLLFADAVEDEARRRRRGGP
jgi:ParB/RepB/Spo0J family partition protein